MTKIEERIPLQEERQPVHEQLAQRDAQLAQRDERILHLEALVEQQSSLIEQMQDRIPGLRQQVTSLQERQSKNSHNSSLPPSSDRFVRQPKSLRQKSEKKAGGQEGQLLPVERACEVLHEVLGVQMSEGTVYELIKRCAKHLESVEHQIKEALIQTTVIHQDETGLYVAGKRYWMHNTSTPTGK